MCAFSLALLFMTAGRGERMKMQPNGLKLLVFPQVRYIPGCSMDYRSILKAWWAVMLDKRGGEAK